MLHLNRNTALIKSALINHLFSFSDFATGFDLINQTFNMEYHREDFRKSSKGFRRVVIFGLTPHLGSLRIH